MYISTNKYGRREYIRFKLSPDNDVYYSGYKTWKSRWGYRGQITYYDEWRRIWPRDVNYWGLSRKSVRRKIAKWLNKHRKADRRYLESLETR